MQRDPNFDAIATLFDAIATRFGAGDIAGFRALYQLPCMVVMPTGAQVVADDAAFTTFFGGMLARLKGETFARSEWRDLTVKTVAPTLALAAMHWTRYRADGSVLEMLGATYFLQLSDGAWRIVSLVGHAPDAVPRLG